MTHYQGKKDWQCSVNCGIAQCETTYDSSLCFSGFYCRLLSTIQTAAQQLCTILQPLLRTTGRRRADTLSPRGTQSPTDYDCASAHQQQASHRQGTGTNGTYSTYILRYPTTVLGSTQDANFGDNLSVNQPIKLNSLQQIFSPLYLACRYLRGR